MPAGARLIPAHAWLRIGGLGGLFIVYHHYVLWYLGRLASEDPNWSHTFLVPLISLYFVHARQDELRRLRPQVCWWGLPVMLAGMAGYALGIYPITNHMVMAYTMIGTLFGLLWLLTGTAMMRILWFPVVFLAFGVKLSYVLWEPVAWQLQRLAATCAGILIPITGLLVGVEADVTGTAIHIYHHGILVEPPVNIAEACSGLRMLVALVTLGTAYAYLLERPWWIRLLLAAATVPVAVAVNVLRVTVVGLIYPFNQQLGTGDFHLFLGLLMVVPALLLLMACNWFLGKLFPGLDEPPAPAPPAAVKR